MHPRVFMISLSLRWEEEKYEDGVKWKFLEHNGPYFPAEYQPLPDEVHFFYNGQLSREVEFVRKEDLNVVACIPAPVQVVY